MVRIPILVVTFSCVSFVPGWWTRYLVPLQPHVSVKWTKFQSHGRCFGHIDDVFSHMFQLQGCFSHMGDVSVSLVMFQSQRHYFNHMDNISTTCISCKTMFEPRGRCFGHTGDVSVLLVMFQSHGQCFSHMHQLQDDV